jgi:hypothetical protein
MTMPLKTTKTNRHARTARNAFVGSWRITDMELWEEDSRDLLGPAYITFGSDGAGEFRFIAVQGWMDCRFVERDGKPRVAFSWQGWDDTDEATGRGWAVIAKNGELKGRIYLHQGDDSSFTARIRDPIVPSKVGAAERYKGRSRER